MALVTLYEAESSVVQLESSNEIVEKPYRSRDKFIGEAITNGGLKIVLGASMFLLTWAIAYVIWTVPQRISTPNTGLGGILIVLLFTIFGIFVPIGGLLGFLRFSGEAVVAFIHTLFKPKMASPEDTIKTFFRAIYHELYGRAYNCLTDTGKAPVPFSLQPIDKMLPSGATVTFDSKRSFGIYWVDFSDPLTSSSLRPQYHRMTTDTIDKETVMVRMPFEYSWHEDKDRLRLGRFENRFLLVKRGEYWFLANGFLLPSVDFEQRRTELIQRYIDQDIVEWILNRELWLGESAEMVEESFGEPENVKQTSSGDIWSYLRKHSGHYGLEILLKDGKVSSWTENGRQYAKKKTTARVKEHRWRRRLVYGAVIFLLLFTCPLLCIIALGFLV